jgi:hypothetical protein
VVEMVSMKDVEKVIEILIAFVDSVTAEDDFSIRL